MEVSLLPVGAVTREVVATLRRRLQQGAISATSLPGRDLPRKAWDPERGQHRATVLLPFVRHAAPAYVLAVTNVDLYAGSLNFVFGQAEVGGHAAVISLHRLRDSHPTRFADRVLKEALHELGHCVGLDHCPRASCVMYFSDTVTDTDAKGPAYCPTCHRRAAPERLWRES